jgi:hypothetical protein
MRRIENHLEGGRPPWHADLELEIVTALVPADHPAVARQRHALGPCALGRLCVDNIAERFEHRR